LGCPGPHRQNWRLEPVNIFRVGEAKDISISDDPALTASPFVTAKLLKVGVELLPLIFSKDQQ
jgi:hypothetical protein